MKTLGLIFLITIYSISSFGLGIEKFYCCGHLKSVSVSLIASGKNKCGKTGPTSGCCKTTFKYFKVKDNHVFAVYNNTFKNISFEPILSIYEPAGFFKFEKVFQTDYSLPPPLSPHVPLYISNSVFRI